MIEFKENGFFTKMLALSLYLSFSLSVCHCLSACLSFFGHILRFLRRRQTICYIRSDRITKHKFSSIINRFKKKRSTFNQPSKTTSSSSFFSFFFTKNSFLLKKQTNFRLLIRFRFIKGNLYFNNIQPGSFVRSFVCFMSLVCPLPF